MINIHKQSILQATILLTVIAFVSRILGFFREVVIANIFGAKAVTDAYLVAQVLPLTLAGLVSGALTTVFIPVFLEEKEKNGEGKAWYAANTVLSVSLVYLIIVLFLSYFFTEQFLRLIAPGFPSDRLELAILMTRMLLPSLLFYGLLGILTGLSQSYKQFLVPGIGGLLHNICIILSILILGRNLPPLSLALGNVLGVFLQVFLVLIYLKSRLPYIKWHIDFSHPAVKKTFYLMIPILLGTSVSYINTIIDRIFASGLPEGSISALNFGARVKDLPVSLFASSLSVAIYPTTSELVVEGENDKIIELLNKAIRFTWMIVIPASIGLIVLDKEIITLLFERGAFDSKATILTASALRYYSIGLFAFSASPIVARTFYSFQDTVTPVIVGFLAVGLNICLNAILIRIMAHSGLALATSISSIFSFILLLILLRKKLRCIGGRKLIFDFIKILFSSLVMGVALHLSKTCLNFIGSEFLKTVVLILLGIFIYSIIMLLVIGEDRKKLRSILSKFIKSYS
ncbi:MAG: murein biosynthesis integral membrane protein MurJ [bacterium]|nr:murein biosynthesis integral membrane protein MurJ [bacterium]